MGFITKLQDGRFVFSKIDRLGSGNFFDGIGCPHDNTPVGMKKEFQQLIKILDNNIKHIRVKVLTSFLFKDVIGNLWRVGVFIGPFRGQSIKGIGNGGNSSGDGNVPSL